MKDLSALVVMDPIGIRNSHREIGGRTIIDRVIGSLSEIGDTIYVVGLDAAANLGRMQLLPGHMWTGWVQALRAGLTRASTDWVFAVGGNWPFVNPGLVRFMMSRRGRSEAVLVRTDHGLQAMHALYSQRCLPLLDEATKYGLINLTLLAAQLRTEVVDITLSPNPMDRLSAMPVQDDEGYRKAVRMADRLLEYEIPREAVAGTSRRRGVG